MVGLIQNETEPTAANDCGVAATHPASQPWALGALFHAYRGRLLTTYALFNVENLFRLAQPFVLGLAIDDLLRGRWTGLVLFVVQHLGHMFIGLLRKMYDTRVFTGIYADLATELVQSQRERDLNVSCIAARSTLAREFVTFFEQYIPVLVQAAYSVVGALAFLVFYKGVLFPICFGLVMPAWLVNRVYARQVLLINGRLHDELEREVEVIRQGDGPAVPRHYHELAHWQIKLSDWEALNFGLMELFVLGLLLAALVVACHEPDTGPGDILAALRYVLMFVGALDSVPLLVQQFSRLRDIGGRLRQG